VATVDRLPNTPLPDIPAAAITTQVELAHRFSAFVVRAFALLGPKRAAPSA
jgi:hypothetical protein